MVKHMMGSIGAATNSNRNMIDNGSSTFDFVCNEENEFLLVVN
jgi:hypothetical protein